MKDFEVKQIHENLLKVSEFLSKCITTKFEENDFINIKNLNETVTIQTINNNPMNIFKNIIKKNEVKLNTNSLPEKYSTSLAKKTEEVELKEFFFSGKYSVNLLNNNENLMNDIMNISYSLIFNITDLCESYELGNFKYYDSINISYDYNEILNIKVIFLSDKMIRKN